MTPTNSPDFHHERLRRLPTLVVAVSVLLVAAVGCTKDEAVSPASQSGREVCGGLFGAVGGKELNGLTGRRAFTPVSDTEQERLPNVVSSMEKATDSSSRGKLSSICSFTVVGFDEGDVGARQVDFESGWKDIPTTDTTVKNRATHTFYSSGSAISDIGGSRVKYGLRATTYFPCELPGNTARTVATTFRGDWSSTADTEAETRLMRIRVLLAASSKLSEALGCTNEPDLTPTSTIKKLGFAWPPKKGSSPE